MYLHYKHNQNNDTPHIRASIVNGEHTWSSYKRYDIQHNDTLDIKLCTEGVVKYEDIFESYTNSSIEIYCIDYLDLDRV